MKKITIFILLLLSFNGNASLINIEVSSNQVQIGETIDVSLIAHDIAPFDLFSFNLDFDTSLFQSNFETFNSDLFATNPYSLFEVNKITSGLAFSFLDFTPVFAGSFTLANFTITAKAEGMSRIEASQMTFYQPFPSTVLLNVASSSATVQSFNVPEPVSSLLWILCFVMMSLGKTWQNRRA